VQQLISLLDQYGLSFVFLHVPAEQVGVPLPAYPTLIVAGGSCATRVSKYMKTSEPELLDAACMEVLLVTP
jgi:membrane protein DedA with SNARE-associated domain